jgi:alpha-tubulin suppressor-like RCC1 family protein
VLTVPLPVISITTQPQDTLSVTGSAQLSVVAAVTQGYAPAYQWRLKKSGSTSYANIAGATGATLYLSGLTNSSNDGDVYQAVVSSLGGAAQVASNTAVLRVPNPTVSIDLQPTIQYAYRGSATFVVSATSSSQLSYQWQKQESGAGAFSNVAGATSSTLVLTNLKYANDNLDVYRVIVSATSGPAGATWTSSVTSDPAPLLVYDTSGQVWVWGGDNSFGQLGNGTYAPSPPPPPTGRLLNKLFADVDCGSNHAVAIDSSGRLLTWGSNDYAQLGRDAGVLRSNTPAVVGAYTNWTAVSAGQHHSAGIAGGSLYLWGDTLMGSTYPNYGYPYQIGTATNWVSVACGINTVFAINTSGELWGFGDNALGQLGDGTTTARASLTRIGSGLAWSKVFAGDSNTFAITTNGALWGWGSGAGSVGDGTSSQRTSPVRIGTASNWVQGSSRAGRSYAVNSAGELWGWGSAYIGDGTNAQRVIPTRIGAGNVWSRVAAGRRCSLAITTLGELWGWGDNTNGQLQDSGTPYLTSPSRIGADTNWSKVSAGDDFVAALTGW